MILIFAGLDAVRLPPFRRAVGTQRNDHEPQEAVPPLCLEKIGRQMAQGPQASAWIMDANASGAASMGANALGDCLQ